MASELHPSGGRDWGALVGTEPICPPLAEPGAGPSLLLLHGYGATPCEMMPLAELGRARGLALTVPQLPGHGTHARDLARTSFSDWYAAAENALLSLSPPVIVGGQSMGAVLAMKLAAQHPARVGGLVALANALRLHWPHPALSLDLLGLLPRGDLLLPKRHGPDIGDPDGRKRHRNYSASPARAALSLQRAGRAVSTLLPRIQCPTLLVHGLLDRVAPVSNVWLAADRIGTAHLEVLILQHSHHILTQDFEVVALCRRVERFIDELREVIAR